MASAYAPVLNENTVVSTATNLRDSLRERLRAMIESPESHFEHDTDMMYLACVLLFRHSLDSEPIFQPTTTLTIERGRLKASTILRKARVEDVSLSDEEMTFITSSMPMLQVVCTFCPVAGTESGSNMVRRTLSIADLFEILVMGADPVKFQKEAIPDGSLREQSLKAKSLFLNFCKHQEGQGVLSVRINIDKMLSRDLKPFVLYVLSHKY